MSRPKLRVGALFAGTGAIELALAQVAAEHPGVEIELVWYCEVDKAASKIMAHHFPDAVNLGDVTKVDWSTVPEVDIITGGSPCQDLSHAGKRAGMKAGTRSGLWASMCDAIDIIRPRLVVWENVRGALSAEADSAVEPCPICVGDGGRVTLRALGRVLGDLAELGYDARWYGLRAADVGAAHGRFRVFVFATPTGADSAELGRWTARRDDGVRPAGLVARDAQVREELRLLPSPRTSDTNGAGQHGPDLRTVASLLPTPTSRDHKGRNQRDDDTCLTGALLPTPRATDGTKGGPNQRGSSGDLMLPSAVQTLPPTPTSADAKASGSYGYGGNEFCTLTDATVRQAQDWREYEAAIRRQERAFGRPAPLPTEPGAKGQPRLSPRFVEWLMGLPDGWVTDPTIGISRNDQLKALGNGVVPQQCAAALRAFLRDESEAAA